MSQLTITCPSCNETFSADQALQKHLKEKEQKYQDEIKVKEKLLKEKYNLDFKLKEKSLEKEISLKIQEQNKPRFQELNSKLEEAEEEKKNAEKIMASKLKQKEQALEKSSKENEAKMVANLKIRHKLS